MAPGSSKWLLADLAPRDGFAMDFLRGGQWISNGVWVLFCTQSQRNAVGMPRWISNVFAMDLRWISNCKGFQYFWWVSDGFV